MSKRAKDKVIVATEVRLASVSEESRRMRWTYHSYAFQHCVQFACPAALRIATCLRLGLGWVCTSLPKPSLPFGHSFVTDVTDLGFFVFAHPPHINQKPRTTRKQQGCRRKTSFHVLSEGIILSKTTPRPLVNTSNFEFIKHV